MSDLRSQYQQRAHAASLRRLARPQTHYARRDGTGVVVDGNQVKAQKVSNEPLGSGDSVVISGDGGVGQQERRKVRRLIEGGRAIKTGKDCVLPGVMVYQYIPTFWQPNSSYGAFDSILNYKEKIIWFCNNGAPVTLYEAERLGRSTRTGYVPDTAFANNTHFWANIDGTGQVYFRYRKALAGEDYYDIWDLSDSGATLRSSALVQPNTHFKGGSLGVGNTSSPPYYLLRETPQTTVLYDSGNNGLINIGGQTFQTAEKLSNGSLNYGLIPDQRNYYSFNLPTMAKDFAIRHGLIFNTATTGLNDEFCWTINGNIAALVEVQVYSLDANGVYVAPVWDNSGNSLVRPQDLKVGSLGSFNQNLTLNSPPFIADEHYWIESLIKPSDINTQEGLGVDLRLIGSYVNMSENCRVQNGTTLGKTPIGRPFTPPYDPNAPI